MRYSLFFFYYQTWRLSLVGWGKIESSTSVEKDGPSGRKKRDRVSLRRKTDGVRGLTSNVSFKIHLSI